MRSTETILEWKIGAITNLDSFNLDKLHVRVYTLESAYKKRLEPAE
jgi:hypothetical protein